MQPAERPGRFSPLFWRVVALNAAVLAIACVVTLVIVSPKKLTSFAFGEALVLAGALVLIAIVNLLLLRRAFSPLARVARLAAEVDPTQPGQRVPVNGDRSEAGLLAVAFNDMLARLERERQQSARRALEAQEQERLRVAQELHDEVGQTLTAVLLQLSRLTKDSPDAVKSQAVEAQASVRASLEDVRRIALELRPEALDELGLASALAALADRFGERTWLRIRLHVDDALPALSKDVELVIYRVAQEALTNVVRHSGVDSADLVLTRNPSGTALCVIDHGSGVDPMRAAEGGGLRGMRERAMMVGARLSIGTPAGGGVEVRLEIPDGEDGAAWSR